MLYESESTMNRATESIGLGDGKKKSDIRIHRTCEPEGPIKKEESRDLRV